MTTNSVKDSIAIPLIDKPRSSSRNRNQDFAFNKPRSSHSNQNSPYGSPTDSSFILNTNHSNQSYSGLKSALRHKSTNSVELFSSEPLEDDFNSSSSLSVPGVIDDSSRGRTGGSNVELNASHLGDGIGLNTSSLSLSAPNSPSLNPMKSSTYSRRVGFDTFNSGVSLESTGSNTGGGTGVNYSFTLSAKSAKFARSKASRTFLVGTDLNEYSVHALDWLLSSLTENNDEVVVLRVIEPGSTAYNQWREQMEESREEAENVLEDVMKKNGSSRELSIIVEFAVGPIEETIHRMIEIYKPDSLIVGTRGKPDSVWKSAFMGSISKYCVAKSPVPVVVVRPEDKVKESLERRLNEPKKRSYLNLLKQNPADTTTSTGTNTSTFSRSLTAPTSIDNRDKEKRKSLEFDKVNVEKEMKRFGTVG